VVARLCPDKYVCPTACSSLQSPNPDSIGHRRTLCAPQVGLPGRNQEKVARLCDQAKIAATRDELSAHHTLPHMLDAYNERIRSTPNRPRLRRRVADMEASCPRVAQLP